MSDNALDLILKAVAFAAGKHRDQRRKDVQATPYINHPIAVASVLLHEGQVSDTNVLCAALLHDTIEDTTTTAEELQQEFGAEITNLVLEVTDDKSLDKSERKRLQIEHTKTISAKAKMIKMADKISNVTDIINVPPSDWTDARRLEYFDWAEAVVAGCRDANQRLADRFDELISEGRHSVNAG